MERTPSALERDLRRPFAAAGGALLAALAFAGPAGAAAIQGAPSELVPVQRLRFEQKCFYDIEEWKGKGEEKFLDRVQAQLPVYEVSQKDKLDELKELLGECYMLRKKHYEEAGDKDQVGTFYNKLLELKSEYGKLKGYREEALEYMFRVQLEAARTAYKANNVEEARRQFKLLLEVPKARDEAVGVLVAIEKSEGGFDAADKSGDLETQLEVFGKVLGKIEETLGTNLFAELKKKNPDILDMDKRRADITNKTQRITVRSFDVSKDLAAVQAAKSPLDLQNATFAFEPVTKDAGTRYPPSGKSEKAPKPNALFYRGTYDVSVFHPDVKDRPVAVFLQFAVGDQPAVLEFPNQVLAGMVYAGSWKGGGRFFVDVTEVTLGEVEAFKSRSEVLGEMLNEIKGKPDEPAWFSETRWAVAYEEVSGKKIPTQEQWLQAAFGPYSSTQRPFPWGTEPPTLDHAFVDPNAQGPRSVGGGSKGRSPFYAEDMAGNMAEWVRMNGELWLMGGHYALASAAQLSSLGGRSPLRDPQPGNEAFDAASASMSTDQKKALAEYRIKNDAETVTGLRMVVPVK